MCSEVTDVLGEALHGPGWQWARQWGDSATVGLRPTHVVLPQNHLPQCVDTLYSKVCKSQKQKSFSVLCAHPERGDLLIPTCEAPVLNQDDNAKIRRDQNQVCCCHCVQPVAIHAASGLSSTVWQEKKRNEVLAVLPTAHSQPANAGFKNTQAGDLDH